MNIKSSIKDSSSSESLYYSPIEPDIITETNIVIKSNIIDDNLITCNCIKDESCFIFYFNQETNEFETINCKKYNNPKN
jgi:hypothetical protein